MGETGFFRWVWRFNALALAAAAIVGLAAGAAALAVLIHELTRERSVAGVVPTRPQAEQPASTETLDGLRPLGRTGLFWAAIRREERLEQTYSTKRTKAVVDYLIYDPESGARRALLGRRPSLIHYANALTAPGPAQPSQAPVVGLAVYFVAEDSDGDGRLTHRDPPSLALARPDGSGLNVVSQGALVLGIETLSPTEALATIERETAEGPRAFALHLDLASRSVLRDVALTPPPAP